MPILGVTAIGLGLCAVFWLALGSTSDWRVRKVPAAASWWFLAAVAALAVVAGRGVNGVLVAGWGATAAVGAAWDARGASLAA